jgi:uncharacterized protein (DUF2236 family)
MTGVPYVAPTSLPFGDGTVTRRVNLEPVIFFGGGRALLLQVAHPLVAAGVADHSDYERDPWRRLARTLDVMMKMAFGAPAESARRARALERRHRAVTGTSPDGVPYRAGDPKLLLWVWATLVDTALTVYERCYGPLSTRDRERFYQEQKLLAQACGVPLDVCPATFPEFVGYFDAVVADDLRVTDQARAVAVAVTGPVLRWPLGPLAAAPLRLVTAGLLPPTLRAGYGMAWGRDDERRLAWLFRVAGAASGVVPRPVRVLPSLALLRSRRPLMPPRFLQAPAVTGVRG